jgi:signal transduction histidine kinase
VLHDFLSANRAALIARTQARLAARHAPRATEEELALGSPLFLDQLAEMLRRSDASVRAMVESAAENGRDLLERGFTVAQVVHDYLAVCGAITELAEEMNAPITPAEYQTLHRCLDEAIAQAVTEYTRLREQAITDLETERLGTLAHEFRNALGAAILSFQTLRMGTVGLGGSTASLLDRSLRRLSALVESSIAHVRLESGNCTPERVSVRELVEDIEVGAAMEASAQGLKLSVGHVERGVDLAVDRQLLAAAVGNLLQNAFKFTRPNGNVSLITSYTSDRVLIEVADECGGLPPGEVDALFRPFEQRGANRTGLGLGLHITRRSVEADGGLLHVRDVPGVGCVFAIELPRLPMSPRL